MAHDFAELACRPGAPDDALLVNGGRFPIFLAPDCARRTLPPRQDVQWIALKETWSASFDTCQREQFSLVLWFMRAGFASLLSLCLVGCTRQVQAALQKDNALVAQAEANLGRDRVLRRDYPRGSTG